MSDTDNGSVSAAPARLKSFVSRLNYIEEEIEKSAADVKEIYNEAKSEGFDTKALRKVVRLLKQDRQKRDAEQMVLDTYMAVFES